ncbi:MAG: hypothetical protein LBR48_07310 [Dysgonamonadaceae bacterium]|jgi:hypothetical protein|nr:hypothetical protein [Dysgonamonadaceae bacterium]
MKKINCLAMVVMLVLAACSKEDGPGGSTIQPDSSVIGDYVYKGSDSKVVVTADSVDFSAASPTAAVELTIAYRGSTKRAPSITVTPAGIAGVSTGSAYVDSTVVNGKYGYNYTITVTLTPSTESKYGHIVVKDPADASISKTFAFYCAFDETTIGGFTYDGNDAGIVISEDKTDVVYTQAKADATLKIAYRGSTRNAPLVTVTPATNSGIDASNIEFDGETSVDGKLGYNYTINVLLYKPTAIKTGEIGVTDPTNTAITKKFTFAAYLIASGALAESNIYWDGSKLTFDTIPGPNTNKAGVLFQWGSLVGISPAQTNNATAFDAEATPIYVPDVAAGTWSATTASAAGWTYTTIPSPSTLQGDEAYTNLVLYEYSDATSYAGYMGDICAYLTNKAWRMPRSTELGCDNSSTPVTTAGWSALQGTAGADLTLNNEAGTNTNISAYYEFGGVVFPLTGARSIAGALSNTNNTTYMWLGSAYTTAGQAHRANLTSTAVNAAQRSALRNGQPIRCIKN